MIDGLILPWGGGGGVGYTLSIRLCCKTIATPAGELRLYNNDILISLWVGPDGKNSDQYVVQVIRNERFVTDRLFGCFPHFA